MIERKPVYYDTFRCTADQCNLTCCQEWKIAVDDETQESWKTVNPPLELMKDKGEAIICHDKLSDYTIDKDDARVIKLDTDKKCPFLNRNKLCNLVISYGDEILSETCAIFPRQVNTFVERDVKEYSLVACCPAVIDILMKQEQFELSTDIQQQKTTLPDSLDTNMENKQKPAFVNGYRAYEEVLTLIRNDMIELVQNQENTISEAMMSGFFVMLSLLENEEREQKKKSNAGKISCEIQKLLDGFGTSSEHKKVLDTIRNMDFEVLDTFEERNELFLDLAENYRKEGIYLKWLEPIARLAEQISEEGYDEEEMVTNLEQFTKSFLPYEKLMRTYVASEYFANLFLPEYDLENVAVAMQWITMEYVIMKHACFLNWMKDEKTTIPYEQIRDTIVIIARMMGYDEPDIREFMENSFEEIIWEWGYLALLCGR